jgi:antirestriction protein
MSEEIKIYVADLAAYNNGKLHGVWIDATQEIDDIQEQINELLANSPEDDAEEYAIHDYEGFAGYLVSEYEGIERAHEVACFIEEHGEIAGELLSHFGDSIDDAQKAIEENYCGCYASLADYAEELTEETTQIPEHLAFYIDYEKMGRDMELGGDVFTIETGYQEVHIFWNH